jgi:hypothetical protein
MSYPNLKTYRSHKVVSAGRITEVAPAGCFVETADPDSGVFLTYDDNMTTRYRPEVGDYWVIYEDGYQAISPRAAFEGGYHTFV